MNVSPKTFDVKFAPLDKDGFVQSFTIQQTQEFLSFFDEFGFVVIDNILPQENINDSIEAIWSFIEDSHKLSPISRHDPTTWEYWPGHRHLGLLCQALDLAAWKNRCLPDLYKAFSTVLREEKLWVSVDNWGILRPTMQIPTVKLPENQQQRTNVEYEGPEKIDKPQWGTRSRWLHWDLNPCDLDTEEGCEYVFEGNFISENNGTKVSSSKVKVQGLLNLIDCRVEDGGFLTVPGFHKHIKEWSAQPHISEGPYSFKTKHLKEHEFCYVPATDPMQNQLQKIPMRAGSLLIWNGLQPHCNYPNASNRFRMVQYVKMFEAQPNAEGVPDRKQIMGTHSPKELQKIDLASKLFGIKDY